MAKALSKSQTAAALAEKVEITKKQAVQFLDELAAQPAVVRSLPIQVD